MSFIQCLFNTKQHGRHVASQSRPEGVWVLESNCCVNNGRVTSVVPTSQWTRDDCNILLRVNRCFENLIFTQNN